MLAALLVVGDKAGFVSASDLPHLDTRAEFGGEALEENSKIDAVLTHVVDRELFFAQDRLHVNDLHVECVLLDEAANDLDLLKGERLQRRPLIQILDGRDAENSPVGS